MNESVSNTLNLAADLIEKRGWARGYAAWGTTLPGGALCLEGGILAAIGHPVDPEATRPWFHGPGACPAYDAVCDYLDRPHDTMLWPFNDDPERTASEVIEVLRAAALIESAREQDAAWSTYAANVAVA